ncbi:MAG: ROK family protein [Firmicutes bacterium]|nr:ROK family protein [Bacillota bacterium]
MLDKVKQNNIKNILTIMLSQGANTKANISFLTGLSNTTVSDCINEVQAINFVSKTGFEQPRGGRRSAIYQINRQYGMFLGIAVLKDSIFFTLTDSCGSIIESFFYEKGKEARILSIFKGIEKACEMGKILAIGIGVHGEVDYQNQTLISSMYDNWSNVPLKELIERRFRIVTYLDNIANHLAVWEKIMGRKHQNFLWANEEPDIEKLGVILNGSVLRGQKNMCGQIVKDKESHSKEAYLASLQNIAQFLDVECIILGSDRSCLQEPNETEGVIPIYKVKAGPTETAGAAAVAVQLEWFFSILRRAEPN